MVSCFISFQRCRSKTDGVQLQIAFEKPASRVTNWSQLSGWSSMPSLTVLWCHNSKLAATNLFQCKVGVWGFAPGKAISLRQNELCGGGKQKSRHNCSQHLHQRKKKKNAGTHFGAHGLFRSDLQIWGCKSQRHLCQCKDDFAAAKHVPGFAAARAELSLHGARLKLCKRSFFSHCFSCHSRIVTAIASTVHTNCNHLQKKKSSWKRAWAERNKPGFYYGHVRRTLCG